MPERITVVVSHAAKANATQRDFEEKVIADLLTQDSVDLTLIEGISSLAQETTGLLCLEGIRGSMVIVTDMAAAAAHDHLRGQKVLGRMGTFEEGQVVVEESAPHEALSPGIYDAMRRTIFYLDIHTFADIHEVGRAITTIQQYLADTGTTVGRSDFPILQGVHRPVGSGSDQSPAVAGSGDTPSVRPMPRRGDREEADQVSQDNSDMDSLVDELDEMEL
jgi:hypothetical protein